MRGLLWIPGVSALLASVAMLGVAAPVSCDSSDAVYPEMRDDPAGQQDADRRPRAEHGTPLSERCPAIRGGTCLPGQALIPRSVLNPGLASGCLGGKGSVVRLRTHPAGDPAPVDTLHSKRVRLQI